MAHNYFSHQHNTTDLNYRESHLFGPCGHNSSNRFIGSLFQSCPQILCECIFVLKVKRSINIMKITVENKLLLDGSGTVILKDWEDQY